MTAGRASERASSGSPGRTGMRRWATGRHERSGASAANTACKLAECGLHTVRELAAADPAAPAADLGPALGPWYVQPRRGLGPVEVRGEPWLPRSRSHEETVAADLTEWAAVRAATAGLARRVAVDVTAECRPASRVGVRVRFAPFTTRSRSTTLAEDLARPRAVDVDREDGAHAQCCRPHRRAAPARPRADRPRHRRAARRTPRDRGAEGNGEAPVADAGRSGHLECAGAESSGVCDLGRYAAQSIDLLIEGSVIAIVRAVPRSPPFPAVPRRSPLWIAGCARSFPARHRARPAGVWPGTRGGAADTQATRGPLLDRMLRAG